MVWGLVMFLGLVNDDYLAVLLDLVNDVSWLGMIMFLGWVMFLGLVMFLDFGALVWVLALVMFLDLAKL